MDLPCDTPEEELLSALLLPGTQHTTSAHRQHQRQQQGTPGATGSSHNATSWASHPALLQLSDLGIWHTDFFGGHTYDRASRLRPVSLRYWWRLQCGGDGSGSGGSMSLRGVGTASMQEYAVGGEGGEGGGGGVAAMFVSGCVGGGPGVGAAWGLLH
jgi:hypothetical protein